MSRAREVRLRIETAGIVAILRGDFTARIAEVGEALLRGGIRAIEMTMNSPEALTSISKLRQALGDQALVGAGTVLSPDEVAAALEHGAQFIVAPDSNPAVIAACNERDCAVIPGVLSANEVATAWRLGATMVKVFPAGLLGPAYVRALRGPLPHIPLVPTGDVDLENVASFFEAGAAAVGIGGSLLGRRTPEDLGGLTLKAAAFVERVVAARSALKAKGT
jgi:2-dehydro-3-deoxyphosphogluconate aldolase/(4S)-4-hydroxy-2-oxoglutarate aldolase